MAPSLEATSVPATDEKLLDKKPIVVDVAPIVENQDAHSSQYPKTDFKLEDHPIDIVQKLRVSGNAAWHPRKKQNTE